MTRLGLEIADIFRAHGPTWRRAHAGHVSLTQLKVMSAIEACRTEALGGHVAISNQRLVSADAESVAFRWKDYRVKRGDRQKVMRLDTGEFIRRFLSHVLPDGFHRIRHYGLLAGATRKTAIAHIRKLRGQRPIAQEPPEVTETAPLTLREPCPSCRGPMCIVEIFRRGQKPSSRAPPREQAA